MKNEAVEVYHVTKSLESMAAEERADVFNMEDVLEILTKYTLDEIQHRLGLFAVLDPGRTVLASMDDISKRIFITWERGALLCLWARSNGVLATRYFSPDNLSINDIEEETVNLNPVYKALDLPIKEDDSELDNFMEHLHYTKDDDTFNMLDLLEYLHCEVSGGRILNGIELIKVIAIRFGFNVKVVCDET